MRGDAVVMAAAMVCAFAVISLPFPAFATLTPMGEVLCIILGMLTTGVAKGLATIGICVMGVAAILGKASWGMAITIGVGIAVMMGSVNIVFDLGLGLADCS